MRQAKSLLSLVVALMLAGSHTRAGAQQGASPPTIPAGVPVPPESVEPMDRASLPAGALANPDASEPGPLFTAPPLAGPADPADCATGALRLVLMLESSRLDSILAVEQMAARRGLQFRRLQPRSRHETGEHRRFDVVVSGCAVDLVGFQQEAGLAFPPRGIAIRSIEPMSLRPDMESPGDPRSGASDLPGVPDREGLKEPEARKGRRDGHEGAPRAPVVLGIGAALPPGVAAPDTAGFTDDRALHGR